MTIDNKSYKRFYYKNKPTDYFISEYGDVYNKTTDHYLTATYDCGGRLSVCLSILGVSVSITVHKLVASTFLGECGDNMTIDHIDGNFLNNHYSNLQYISSSENTLKYLVDNDIHGFDKKYSDMLIQEICSKLKDGIYYRDLASSYNLPIAYMYDIVHNNIRKNIVSTYLPFPTSAYRVKKNRSYDKKLIKNMVKQNYTNIMICSELNVPHNNANLKLITKIRKKLGIKDPKFLDDTLKDSVYKLIKSGYTNKEILKELNLEYTDKIQNLLGRARYELKIHDFNRDGIPKSVQKDMKMMIEAGKSNNQILSFYNLERNKYTINLLGKLRQKVKNKKSTTIENTEDDYYKIIINV